MTDEHSVRQLVDELSNAALRDLLRNVRHHTELRRRISAGFVDERWVNQAYREYARREGPAYRREAADLTLQYYTELADLGNRYSERFYADVLDDLGGRRPSDGAAPADGSNGARPSNGVRRGPPVGSDAPDDGPAPEEVSVELHGPLGREVMARFGVENTETRPVALSIEVGACRGPDQTAFFAPLTVQPAEFTLEPGASRQITLRLLMLPSAFVPGNLYRLPLVVRGADEIRLVLTIWAEERDTGSPPPAEPRVAGPAPAGPPSAEPEPPPVEPGQVFLVRCPDCARDFQRSERSTRLYPHNTPAGEPCPARVGRVRPA